MGAVLWRRSIQFPDTLYIPRHHVFQPFLQAWNDNQRCTADYIREEDWLGRAYLRRAYLGAFEDLATKLTPAFNNIAWIAALSCPTYRFAKVSHIPNLAARTELTGQYGVLHNYNLTTSSIPE